MKPFKLPQEEKFVIPISESENIVGYIRKADSPIVMIICSGGKPVSTVPRFAEVLALYHKHVPVNIVRFDYRGTGESKGKKQVDLRNWVDDMRTVIEYARKDYKKVILYTPSMATLASLILLKTYTGVDKLVTVNGLFNMKEVGLPVKLMLIAIRIFNRSEYKTQLEYVKNNLDLDKISLPVYVCYSTKDTWVNPKQSIDFYNRKPDNRSLIPVKDSGHYMTDDEGMKYTDTMMPALYEWIKK